MMLLKVKGIACDCLLWFYEAGSPFSQDLKMWDPHAPAPHHPRCVESSQKPPGNTCTKRPERLQRTEQDNSLSYLNLIMNKRSGHADYNTVCSYASSYVSGFINVMLTSEWK